MTNPVLCVVVCGADPASDVGKLVELAQAAGWSVAIVATPSAVPFLDVDDLEALTGNPVRSEYSAPGEPRARSAARATAAIVAPATYNTINKLAAGISDTYALGVLAEAVGLGKPTVIVPFVNAALAARTPFRRSVEQLRAEGVDMLLGSGGWEPHAPGTGGELRNVFPWTEALDVVGRRLMRGR